MACGDGATAPAATSVAGQRYAMHTFDGQRMPAVLARDGDGEWVLLGDTLAFGRDGTVVHWFVGGRRPSNGQSAGQTTFTGVYTESGGGVRMDYDNPQRSPATGSLVRGELTVTDDGFNSRVYVYRQVR